MDCPRPPDFQYILVGKSFAGKTALLQRLTTNTYQRDTPNSPGSDIKIWKANINGKEIKLFLYDTTGIDRFLPICIHYCKEVDGALFVYDITSMDSFEDITFWMKGILPHCKPNLVSMLIGNKSDLEVNREVTYQEGLKLAKEHGMLFMETSAKTAKNVKSAFIETTNVVLQNLIVSDDITKQETSVQDVSDFRSQQENKRQQHRRACREVIRKKLSLRIRPVRFNYVGLPRSGKTSFWRRLMREIRNIVEARRRGEKEQPSTGVAEAGGQVIIRNTTHSTLGAISTKEWSRIRDQLEEGGMLSQVFYQTAQDIHRASASSFEENSKPKASKFKSILFKALATIMRFFTEATDSDTSSAGMSAAEGSRATDAEFEELFSVINDGMKTHDWDEVKYILEDLTLLISTDTGGQAEFLDLHASLVQGPSFNLLFSRLVDELDSQFEMYYTNEDGVSTEKEESTMTVEEVLFQALSSIACFSGTFCDDDDTPSGEASNMKLKTPRHSKSKVMFVGTHADQVSEEEFKEKDKLLQKKIERTEFFDKDIIEFASEDQLMLSVDNMNGSEDEMDEIRCVLERVIEKCFEKVTIPASWLLFSLYMRSKKVRTMSLEQCEKLAKKAGISRSELQEALWFLHHRVGVLLYYPEVEALKGTVICDIQIVFDSATNLIRNTFTFDKVGKSLSKKFREKAQFSLQDVVKATSGHTDALIPLENLVKLLEYLGILTAIPSTPSADVHGEPTYFMPCVLKSARASELNIPSSTDSDPAPLILRYDCGYVPVGVFPSMITNLVSQRREDWEMIEDGLFKNRVQFHVGEDFDTITFISHPQYFEIAVSRNTSFHTPIESLCAHVRSVIQSTLKTATSHMNYHFSMGYKFGFECPTHPGREHFCIQSNISARNMVCLQNPRKRQPVLLADHPKLNVWFSQEHPPHSTIRGHPKGSTQVPVADSTPPLSQTSSQHVRSYGSTPQPPPASGMTIVKDKDVGFLMGYLCRHSSKWEDIGTALHFLPGELENIRHSPQATTLQLRLKKVLCKWVQWPTTAHSQTPTMEMLHDALRSDLVGLGAMANQLYDARNYLPSRLDF